MSGVPERIRTAGLPLRRRTLYPAELQKHVLNFAGRIPQKASALSSLRRRTLYPAELQKHPLCHGPNREQAVFILTIMRFVKLYLKNLSPNPSKSRCLIRRLIKYHIALQPDLSLKPSANRRFSVKSCFAIPTWKYDVAAFQLQIVNVFSCDLVLLFYNFCNLTNH